MPTAKGIYSKADVTCPVCGRLCKGSGGLGGHMQTHYSKGEGLEYRKNRKENKLLPALLPPVVTPKLDAVDICATALQAILLPDQNVPVNKMGAWFRWVRATEHFLEEMNGNNG